MSNDVPARIYRRFLSEPVLTSDGGSDNASGRPLVVLTVRGTVTLSERILNVSKVFDARY